MLERLLPRLSARRSPGRLATASVIGLAIGLFFTTVAGAGALRGNVSVPPVEVQEASINPYPGIAGTSTAPKSTARRSAAEDVVVYLTGPTVVAAGRGRAEDASLYQVNTSFQPRVLGVSVGATVDFPNEDIVFHNVFSYSKAKKFDLGYYGKGKSKRVTFDKPGLVKVFCDIHSSMSAFILVVETPYVTTADENGDYRFDNVPPGRYTVNYWHPEHGERQARVTVDDEIATANMRY